MAKPVINVFISYAHKDAPYFEVFKEGVRSHLANSSIFDFGTWEDSELTLGSDWDQAIQQNLGNAGIAILCVSTNFLNSRYIRSDEFEAMINKYPQTIVIPVYFNHCNMNAWEELTHKQFFKPAGDRYDEAARPDFAFCDLISFNKTNGVVIPNPNTDLYFHDFVTKIESAVEKKTGVIPVRENDNNNLYKYRRPGPVPGFWKNQITTDKIVLITIAIVMVFSATLIFYSLLFNALDDEGKFKCGLGCAMFFGSGVLFVFNRKSKLNQARI